MVAAPGLGDMHNMWPKGTSATAPALRVFAVLAFAFPLEALAKGFEPTPRELTLIFVGGSAGDASTPTLASLRQRLQSIDPSSR